MKNKGIDLVVGTRPDIIKMAPLILELDRRGIPFKIKYTGQHKRFEMFDSFVELFGLNEIVSKNQTAFPYYNVGAVYGDTDSCFKWAYEYKRSGREVLHVEAGLRCADEFMLEEMNRRLTDRISNYFFCPTNGNLRNIFWEGLLTNNKAWITGNLISDSLNIILEKLDPNAIKYNVDILVTIHRRENIYNKHFPKLLEQLRRLQEKFEVIFPIHPHTLDKLPKEWKKSLNFMSPLSYLEFIQTLRDAKIVITDSGGVLEESCILRKPCIVTRKYTERLEAMDRNGILCPDYTKLYDLCLSKIDKDLEDYSNIYDSPASGKTVAETMADLIEEEIIC
jgi:UDP-N-acetylglucosamine 2-epimerase (non-hydrolysing)